ncbi:hypothetical protein GNI_164390 [Gregarina niphandrodes]|uniref:Uncharacterized protein n=1 Tax=Gregarina niphandrodes TaxID=110365 RepID=A0A023AY83_GRENI|nr:hypothetical protein GNI_164390 [Gregarina niphandrodes]EZG43616.1 hypothetical protein GNI_164390 [Gregarina niphandrodes]|eukprot:XP_011133144.1 hypothetical protein GNI_164390 [Gregarina niphandrodes]
MFVKRTLLAVGGLANVVHNPQATDVCGCQVSSDLKILVNCLDQKVADGSCTDPLLLDTITYSAAADVCLREGPVTSSLVDSISPKVMKSVTVAIDPMAHMEFSAMQVQVDQLCTGLLVTTGNVTSDTSAPDSFDSDRTTTKATEKNATDAQCPTLKTINGYTSMNYTFDDDSKMLTVKPETGDTWTVSDAQYFQLWVEGCTLVDDYQAVALSTVYEPVLPRTQGVKGLFGAASFATAFLVLVGLS